MQVKSKLTVIVKQLLLLLQAQAMLTILDFILQRNVQNTSTTLLEQAALK
jgi:hypothetical protein